MEHNREEPEIWDEHQWEEFMRESDKRTEKYVRLMDECKDHPDCDRIIAIKMGWFHLLSETDCEDKPNWLDEHLDEYEEGEEWKQITGYEPTEFDDFEDFPLYQKAQDYTLKGLKILKNQLKGVKDNSIDAFANSLTIAPAKIAGGFSFGFEMESLGGNIANCKRGLTAANRMLTALQEMRDKKIIDSATFRNLYTEGKEVRDDLAVYIVELRERFRRGIS
ncbi:MAG: hypothetical protein WEA58_15125 [Balneolaceae bacterium]